MNPNESWFSTVGLPNDLKKRQIRPLLSYRIQRFISVVGQHLKRQIPGLHSPPQVRLSGKTQSNLDQYDQTGQSSTDQSDAADELDHPGQSDDDTDPQEPGRSADGAQSEEQTDNDRSTGLIYARVSSEGQLSKSPDSTTGKDNDGPDEGSIQGQVDELQSLAERKNVAIEYEPIVDEAETGTDFDRDGIREVLHICRNDDIDFLLVEKVDRIGRNAAETIYFIYHLQQNCGVTLLTPSGEHDVGENEGLLQTTLRSLMSDVQNEIRTNKARKERIRGFLEKKNWHCVSPKVPLGYTETDDGWLEVDPDEKPIVRDMFATFLDRKEYKATKRHIDAKYGKQILDGHQVKTLLTNPVYKGQPKVPEEWLEDTTYENDLDEPELDLLGDDEFSDVLLPDDAFEQTQDIVDAKNQRNSSDDDAYSLTDFIDEFGLFAVIEGSESAKLVHSCGEPMVKSGQRKMGGGFNLDTHTYYCPNCDEYEDPESCYRKWPRESELNQIELIQQILDGDISLTDLSDE